MLLLLLIQKAVDGRSETVCTTDLLLAAPVNFEGQAGKPLAAEVQATDKGKLTITDRWEITVTDTNDPPTVSQLLVIVANTKEGSKCFI